MNKFIYLAWFQSFIAVVGSLLAEYAFNIPACSLCWYQRIFMFPIFIVMCVAVFRKAGDFCYYILPLSIMGLSVSIYHSVLFYRASSVLNLVCSTGASCTDKSLEIFGFITIPLLSFLAFAFITTCILGILIRSYGKD